MELLNQMDGFDALGKVQIILAANRSHTLDPALLRIGRLDRKVPKLTSNEQFEERKKVGDTAKGVDKMKISHRMGNIEKKRGRDGKIQENQQQFKNLTQDEARELSSVFRAIPGRDFPWSDEGCPDSHQMICRIFCA